MTGSPFEIGIFAGAAVLLASLIPVWKMRMAQKNNKNPKRVFYEPTMLKAWLCYIPAASILFILVSIPYMISGYTDWIMAEIDHGTFRGGFIMVLQMFIPLYGPLVIYGYYAYMNYDKVVLYKSPEWNKYRKSLKTDSLQLNK